MAKDTEKLITNSGEIAREPNGQLKKGVVLNPNGRPKGALDFKTKWEVFIDKVAKSNNLTPQEIDEQLFAVGFKKAKEGDYAFYRDLHDRLYGKPQSADEQQKPITVLPILVKFIDKPNATDDRNTS